MSKNESLKFYTKFGPNKKLITVKHPTKDDNSDWEYVIVDKDDAKKVNDNIKNGNIKDMKTIIFNTINMIGKARQNNGK